MFRSFIYCVVTLSLLSSCGGSGGGSGGGGGSSSSGSSPSSNTSSTEPSVSNQEQSQRVTQPNVQPQENEPIVNNDDTKDDQEKLVENIQNIDEQVFENAFNVLNDEENYQYQETTYQDRPLRHYLKRGPKVLKEAIPYFYLFEIDRNENKKLLTIHEINMQSKINASKTDYLLPERLRHLRKFQSNIIVYLKDSNIYSLNNGSINLLTLGLDFKTNPNTKSLDPSICQ